MSNDDPVHRECLSVKNNARYNTLSSVTCLRLVITLSSNSFQQQVSPFDGRGGDDGPEGDEDNKMVCGTTGRRSCDEGRMGEGNQFCSPVHLYFMTLRGSRVADAFFLSFLFQPNVFVFRYRVALVCLFEIQNLLSTRMFDKEQYCTQ
jgi:hypothetical protein